MCKSRNLYEVGEKSLFGPTKGGSFLWLLSNEVIYILCAKYIDICDKFLHKSQEVLIVQSWWGITDVSTINLFSLKSKTCYKALYVGTT